jgi:hypothetical protein
MVIFGFNSLRITPSVALIIPAPISTISVFGTSGLVGFGHELILKHPI